MIDEKKALKARRSRALRDAYLDWADEQAGRFEPSAEWAANDPTAYAEHPELLSSSAEAEAGLRARQTAALSDLGLLPSQSLTAAGSFNDDQLRVPRGNGRLSGRWVEMPGSILQRLLDSTPSSGGRARTVDLRPATPEDRVAFKEKFGRSIPPAWTDVKVDLGDGADLIARGKDKQGRSVYLYTDAYRAQQDAAKFSRLRQVFEKVPDIEAALSKIDGDPTKAAARLMLVEGIRVGSSEDQKGRVMAYGATTLRRDHASVLPNGNVGLKFVAKEGIPVEYEVDDPELKGFIKARVEAPDLPDDAPLFETNDGKTIDLLREVSGLPDFKNHDLRTLLANRLALLEVYDLIPPPPESPKRAAALRKQVAERVSAQLRNKPAQALTSYINPAVFAPLMEAI